MPIKLEALADADTLIKFNEKVSAYADTLVYPLNSQ